jgi:Zn-dependent protease with chaperone function
MHNKAAEPFAPHAPGSARHATCIAKDVRLILLGLVCGTLGLGTGCTMQRASSGASRHDVHDVWVRWHGGVLALENGSAYQKRVEAAVVCLKGASSGTACVQVLDTSDAAAYAWPDGSIFASRGLVDLLSDDELAAALAHEMGHLIDDGWLRSPVALSGHPATADCEMRADDVACALLRGAGLGEQTLARTLRRVSGTLEGSDPCRPLLAARIARLEASARR